MEVDQLFEPILRHWQVDITLKDHGQLFIEKILLKKEYAETTLEFTDETPIGELGALIQSAIGMR